MSIHALPASYLWHICGLGSLLAIILCHGLRHNASSFFPRSPSPGAFRFVQSAHLIWGYVQFADHRSFSRKYAQQAVWTARELREKVSDSNVYSVNGLLISGPC